MPIWELRYDGLNDNASLLQIANDDTPLSALEADGKPKCWEHRPIVEPSRHRRTKKLKPRIDLSYVIEGAIALSPKAYAVLKDFLLPFGQLLEMDCLGEVEYYYNVTHLINCIDYERSGKTGTAVVREIFLPNVVPDEPPLIFKDTYTARTCIYFNQAARDQFEQLCQSANLFGARFVEPGKGIF